MMGYTSIIDRKNKQAKIKFEERSVYIVKTIYKGKIVLGTAKTKIGPDGKIVYEKFENLYVKYKDALWIKSLCPDVHGKIQGFFQAVFGLAYFCEQKIKSL